MDGKTVARECLGHERAAEEDAGDGFESHARVMAARSRYTGINGCVSGQAKLWARYHLRAGESLKFVHGCSWVPPADYLFGSVRLRRMLLLKGKDVNRQATGERGVVCHRLPHHQTPCRARSCTGLITRQGVRPNGMALWKTSEPGASPGGAMFLNITTDDTKGVRGRAYSQPHAGSTPAARRGE